MTWNTEVLTSMHTDYTALATEFISSKPFILSVAALIPCLIFILYIKFRCRLVKCIILDQSKKRKCCYFITAEDWTMHDRLTFISMRKCDTDCFYELYRHKNPGLSNIALRKKWVTVVKVILWIDIISIIASFVFRILMTLIG